MRVWRPTVCALPLLVAFPLIMTVHPAVAQSGIGQRFIAPTDNFFLQSVFTGGLRGPTVGASYSFVLHELDTWTIVGTIFQQAVSGPVATNQTVMVNTLLTPGAAYAFLLRTEDGSSTQADLNFAMGDDYAVTCGESACSPVLFGGGVFLLSVVDFELNFSEGPPSVVPEPLSLLLLGTGLIGVGAVRRRRRAHGDTCGATARRIRRVVTWKAQ